MREYSWHFYCRPVSVFYSLCRYQIDLSCHCGRSAGGVEFLSDCNGSASDLYLLFGRHFCGYVCIRFFGDAVYEGFSWIRMKCFHKKETGSFRKKMVHGLQKVKYIVLALILLSCLTGVYGKLTGTSPWDVFFHAHGRTAPEQQISGGNCVPGADHCGNVYTGKVFLPVSLSHGSGFCINANPSGCTVSENQ